MHNLSPQADDPGGAEVQLAINSGSGMLRETVTNLTLEGSSRAGEAFITHQHTLSSTYSVLIISFHV